METAKASYPEEVLVQTIKLGVHTTWGMYCQTGLTPAQSGPVLRELERQGRVIKDSGKFYIGSAAP